MLRIETLTGADIDSGADLNATKYNMIIKNNDNGFTHLILSLTPDKDIEAVAYVVSSGFPSGYVKEVWESFSRNYTLVTTMPKD